MGYFNALLLPLIVATRLAKRAIGRDSADAALPAAPINAVLRRIFGAERSLVGRIPMPVGASLYLVARRAS